ncbi:MAG: hypothetical protein KIS62_01185 [Ramlibacter sp.]|nr:hypothetical protein [Ramlibacter sp.]
MCFDKKTPIIHSYSREQAFADGVLVNLSESAEWKEAGFRMPVACTRAVWDAYIAWTDDDTNKQTVQDQSGRLWDVLFMLRHGIATSANTNSLLYQLHVVPRDGKSRRARRITLKALAGPGDYAEPVITIMMPNED